MSELKRYMVPGGHGIEAHKAGLLYRKADADEVIDALRAQLAEAQAQVQTALEQAAQIAIDYGEEQYAANVAYHPQYANDAQEDGQEIAHQVLALIQPTEPRTDAAKEE